MAYHDCHPRAHGHSYRVSNSAGPSHGSAPLSTSSMNINKANYTTHPTTIPYFHNLSWHEGGVESRVCLNTKSMSKCIIVVCTEHTLNSSAVFACLHEYQKWLTMCFTHTEITDCSFTDPSKCIHHTNCHSRIYFYIKLSISVYSILQCIDL